MEWIVANKEWFFSGIGIAIPIALLTWYFNKNATAINQKQKSGKNSVNIQVGKNLNIKK